MLDHCGTEELTTARLVLRRYRVEDSLAMYQNWASDPEVTRFLTWTAHASQEVTRNILNAWVESYVSPTVYHWGITLDGELIGDIAVCKWSEGNESAEIGYCLSRRFWGMGIMTEALARVLDFLFDRVGFHRIKLTHDVKNKASGRVMQKCGMQYEGVARDASRYPDGRFCDIASYGILRTDPRPHCP